MEHQPVFNNSNEAQMEHEHYAQPNPNNLIPLLNDPALNEQPDIQIHFSPNLTPIREAENGQDNQIQEEMLEAHAQDIQEPSVIENPTNIQDQQPTGQQENQSRSVEMRPREAKYPTKQELKMENFPECTICLEIFDSIPIWHCRLNAQHSFCNDCRMRIITCPFDRDGSNKILRINSKQRTRTQSLKCGQTYQFFK